jgi:hypothetical protein
MLKSYLIDIASTTFTKYSLIGEVVCDLPQISQRYSVRF